MKKNDSSTQPRKTHYNHQTGDPHIQENHTIIAKMSIKREGEVQVAHHGGHGIQMALHGGPEVQVARHGGHGLQVARHGGHGLQVSLQIQVHSSSQRCNSKTVDRNMKIRVCLCHHNKNNSNRTALEVPEVLPVEVPNPAYRSLSRNRTAFN